MKNRHRVVWTKGMFLTPQHFQIQDQFFEHNIQFRFAASHYANWGVARRTFRFLFEGEYLDGFSKLRIAQVIRNPAGIPILNPQFIAPCLNLASSRYLTTLLRRQIEILATKSAALSGPRRQRGKLTAEFSTSETASFLASPHGQFISSGAEAHLEDSPGPSRVCVCRDVASCWSAFNVFTGRSSRESPRLRSQ
jgi:predicted component of type VI protein secretion system